MAFMSRHMHEDNHYEGLEHAISLFQPRCWNIGVQNALHNKHQSQLQQILEVGSATHSTSHG